VIVLAREDVEVHPHALQTMTEQIQLSSWETASLFGNNVWIMGYTWLPNLSAHFLAVIRP
jgi:hypothetical protein